ncbi:MAG: DUF2607 family protein [Acidobacteriia bacterium]|nr:DUF2607 family protein [Terriglobia bacterium]
MRRKLRNFARSLPWKGTVVCACLLLVVMSAAVQALHLHPTDLDDAKHCSVCQLAHSAIHVSAPAALTVSAHATAYLHAVGDSEPHSNLTSFALFSRPPPLV